jgi:hypothetical protein
LPIALTIAIATLAWAQPHRRTALQYDKVLDWRIELDRSAIESLKAKGDKAATTSRTTTESIGARRLTSGRSFRPASIRRSHPKTTLFGATGTLFRKCARSARCRADYIAAVRRLTDRFEQMNLIAMMDRVAAVIADAVAADPKKPYRLEDMRSARARMRQFISSRPKEIRELHDLNPVSQNSLDAISGQR